MKITFWQQFSSNHSNSFSLVGVFSAEDQALKAYERLVKLLEDIRAWRKENDEDYEYESPTPHEEAIARQYKFEWDSEPSEQVMVRRYKDIVEVRAPADSWTRRRPYQMLLRRLGAADTAGWDGAPQADDFARNIFRAKITANAESEAKADDLLQALQTKLDEANRAHFDTYKKAVLSKEGQKLSVANLPMIHIRVFGSLVDLLTEGGCTDVHYQLEKHALSKG